MPTTSFDLFELTFPRLGLFSYLNTVRTQLKDCHSCLDIGCGEDSPVRLIKFERSTGAEGYPPALEAARRNGTHSDFRLVNATELDKHFSESEFDCCVGLDLIEHLTKDDGLKLIREMERIASKKILLFTPNGFLPQQSHDGDLQEHLSGWSAEEMKAMGFTVIGMHGPKILRGHQHQHRIKPAALAGLIAALLNILYTRWFPRHAAAILCVKDVRSTSK